MTHVPEGIAALIADLGRGLSQLADRAEDYRLARAYYEGNADEFHATKLVERILHEEARAHPLSFAHIPVDALAEKVQLAGIRVEGDARAEQAVEALVEELDLIDEADDWHLKALYFGDYYVVAKPLEETDEDEATVTSLTFSAASPLSAVMVYSAQDSREALFGVRRWSAGSGEKKKHYAAVYYDDATVMLQAEDGSKGDKAEDYAPVLEEGGDDYRIPHPGGMKLLVHYPSMGRPYGVPAHAKGFGPQDAITKISATNLATVEGQGFPFRYALMDPAAEADDDLDADFGDDGPDTAGGQSDGMTTATTGLSRVKARAGAMAILRGIKSIGQLDSAESSTFLANLDWYVRAMAVATGTPLFEFDMSGDQPSGESRRRASSRINRKAEKAQAQMGAAHRRLIKTMLGLMGFDVAASSVTVAWKPTEVETDAEGMELVGSKIANGVPVRVALAEAGYPSNVVDEWLPGDDFAVTPNLLAALAVALKELGSAATLGVISDAQLALLLPQLFGQVRGDAAEPVLAAMQAAEE